ncbi:tRNA (adenosine(37)-N6)-threonylcarbamoyltransferase complex ATPase subunit type 1 TsaE [Alicycliphilus denitrificans]|uniref:tRNA (adenosine(37)-N6)-threonylcarbamoyltransferase complex ATPase subunit type 1 TsaE n=1 Tax=Alicycliphilus denitrificans TaxID=179636 RepID=UPI00384CC305
MTAADHHHPIVETPHRLSLHWQGEDDTARFAARLAAQPGLANAFIALHGDLGAGKTTLVRHLLRALGVAGRIKSPTYAVVEPHQAPGLAIWHFDFYRFHDPREWEDAGFRDIFAGPGLKLAEWPNNAAGLTPPADIAIYIEAEDDQARHVTLQAHTPPGCAILQGLDHP